MEDLNTRSLKNRNKFFVSMLSLILILATTQLGSAQEANKPTWEVGDTWSLGNPDFNFNFEYTYQYIDFDVTGNGSSYIIYEVVSKEGQEYEVEMDQRVEIDMSMELSGQASGSMDEKVLLKGGGTLYYSKDELELKREETKTEMEMEFSGSFTAEGETGSLDRSMVVDIDISIDFNPPLDLFDFPITVGESWSGYSTATMTGDINGEISMEGEGAAEGTSTTEPVDKSIDRTIEVSPSISCTNTEEIPSASTAYKLDLSGTGLTKTSPFPAGSKTLYYSPDKGFIVKSELDFSKMMESTTFGREGEVPFVGGIADQEMSFTLNPVPEAEAREAIKGGGGGGLPLTWIGIGVIIMIGIIAVLRAKG